ncbi:DUF2931 family protein [Apibacter sp. B3889]|uniref:DUF2931 family protein n=1 Tax=unclassified Apibacter TaxID=2630820 RepID=UPI001328C8FE|nr:MULTISPECIES: DUF2931 family protein [unclassified Apibacter]MXO34927.1 DUF2931 family protein [Apibacter sp. B3883]MXO41968.1 DUF2931 family protein [Apibacter sp. B3889]MXP03538.1 DUF2931 family protein [Apibacter sp. B3887]MXP08225.1 DUF2931 family protein [Apibacter sp. B3935]
MKLKIKNHYLIALLQLLSVVVSCQDKNKKTMKEEFDWKETVSCPSGYPVDVFMGGLELTTGGYTSLYSGVVDNAEWGSAGRSMSSGVKPLPKRLNVIWISFAEKTFYHVDAELDYEKIARLFTKGYFTPSISKDNPEPFKENYRTINVGFAPGGVAVVWVAGIGRQIEVGRFQGVKTEIPKEQVEKLKDEPEYSMLRPEYQESIMKNPGIIPQEVQEANKNKPIPYGLWDTYRKKYNWKFNFDFPNSNEITNRVTCFYFNGEKEILFGDKPIKLYQIPEELRWNKSEKKAIPKKISFSWIEKENKLRSGAIIFNEAQIFKTFEELTQGNTEESIQLTVRIIHTGDDASVWLEGNGKSIGLYKSEVKIF